MKTDTIEKLNITGVRKSFITTNLLERKTVLVGFVMAVLIFTVAIGAPAVAPHDPLAVDMPKRLMGPGADYWLGTDHLGRCIASRLIWGARASLIYSMSVLCLMMIISIPVGLLSGYVGGRTDLFIMRVIDICLSLPTFLLALAIAGALGPSVRNMIIAMVSVWWAPYARLIRGMTIQMKEQDFMLAAKAAACSHRQMLFRHILRNIAPAIIVMAALEVGAIILAIAAFSFIGLGAQPPVPEWGIMLSDSREFIQTQPQLMIYPGLAIVITVTAFNLLGDGLKNAIHN